jgi:8-oxo-dGTP pyrophosphatase MutT (NUDIX family)
MAEAHSGGRAWIRRPSGRVILINQLDQVLLFGAGASQIIAGDQRVWVLPGGGSEEGEDPAVTAARELYEETGLKVEPKQLQGPVGVSGGPWTFRGINYLSEDSFYFLRIAAWEVSTVGFSALEQELFEEHRWWSLAELASTSETVFPRELAPLVARLLAGDVPADPVELPW